MQDSWIVLLPPLIVLFLAFFTKKIIFSLIIGVILASFIKANFSLFSTIIAVKNALLVQILNIDNLYIFSFLIAIGTIISLVTFVGGTQAYARLIKKKIKTVRGAESASILLSLLLLFDDFFSSITVGSIMRPLTEHFSIARTKLAFLIDSMAAPLVVIMPISSWIATMTMQLAKGGISGVAAPSTLILSEPYSLYLHIIPFIFYSFILIASVLFIVQRRISYGPMKQHELQALAQQPIPLDSLTQSKKGTFIDFIIPMGFLLSTIFIAILYAGDYHWFGGNNSLSAALAQTNIFFALFWGSFFALISSFIFFFTTKKITLQAVPFLLKEGFLLMNSSITMLFFSWVFSNLLLIDLHSGDYLASLLNGNIPLFLLPAIFFVLSAITSIGIGSSWGTIAIMVPLAIPLIVQLFLVTLPTLPTEVPLLLPTLGAIFGGAVAGDHISPLSSTTVMSAMSSGTSLAHHVQTQVPYALPAIISCIIAYIIAGLLVQQSIRLSIIVSLSVGIFLCFSILIVLNKRAQKKTW